jgi:hypothetical protein
VKILVTGKGGETGSWKIRGDQLGTALGATVKPLATFADFKTCDLAVVVKRTPSCVLDGLLRSKKPWVFDAVDFYPQPEASHWTREEAIAWVRGQINQFRPTAVVWPCQRMMDDCGGNLPGMVLKHHHRPVMRVNPVRESVTRVGYDGDNRYLADWREELHLECLNRGWRFIVNPDHLADVDIAVAFRGGRWNGYVQQHWKSNVKLANAHASGTPFVGQRECGYVETSTGAEYWVANRSELKTAFDWLEPLESREEIHKRFVAEAYSVHAAASDLRRFLSEL